MASIKFSPPQPPNPPTNLTQPSGAVPSAGKPTVQITQNPEERFVTNAESQAQGENQYWDWLWQNHPAEVWKAAPLKAAAYAAHGGVEKATDSESIANLVIPKPEETAVKQGIVAPEPEIGEIADIPEAIPAKKFAYRGALQEESEISGARYDQASESPEEARSYAKQKGGKVQRIDISKLPKDSFEVSGGIGTPNLYRFKGPVPKEAVEEIENYAPVTTESGRKTTLPPEKTTGAHDSVIKQGGAIPGGRMQKVGKMEHDLILFHDPQTGSTLALPENKISVGNIQQHMIDSRSKFSGKTKNLAEIPGAVLSKP